MSERTASPAGGPPSSNLDHGNSIEEMATKATQRMFEWFKPSTVALFLFSKEGRLVRTAIAGADASWLAHEAYERTVPIIAEVVDAPGPRPHRVSRKKVESVWDDVFYPEYVKKFGTIRSTDWVSLDGPNRTFGFVRLVFKNEGHWPTKSNQDDLLLTARHTALSISALRRRLELNAHNALTEFQLQARPPMATIYDHMTRVLVDDWTEYSVAILRVVDQDRQFAAVSFSAVDGIPAAPRDHVPRTLHAGLVGQVLATGKDIIIDDVEARIEAFQDADWIRQHGLKWFACIALKNANKTLGALSLFARYPLTLYETKRNFINDLCSVVVTAATITRLLRTSESHGKFLRRLVGPTMDQGRVEALLQDIVEAACALVEGDYGYIALASRDDRLLHPIAFTPGLQRANLPTLTVDGDDLAAHVFTHGESINCRHVRTDPKWAPRYVDFLGDRAGEVMSNVIVPLTYENLRIGVLSVQSRTEGQFTGDDLSRLEALSAEATLSYQRQKFYQAATRLANANFGPHDRTALYRRILTTATEIASVRTAWLYLLRDDGKGRTLKVVDYVFPPDIPMPSMEELTLPANLGRTWEAFIDPDGVPKVFQHIGDDPDFYHRDVVQAAGLETMLALPLVLRAEPDDVTRPTPKQLGALNLFAARPCVFSQAELSIFRALATAASFALEEERLLSTEAEYFDKAIRNTHLVSVGEVAIGVAHDALGHAHGAMAAFEAATVLLYSGDKPERRPPVKRELDKTEAGLNQLRLTLESLRLYSRLTEPAFKNVQIDEVIEEAIFLLGFRLRRLNVRLRKELKSTPPIRMDRQQIIRAIVNLLANSLDAMKERGQLFIGTELFQADRYVRVRIIDDGVSFDEDLIAKVFERFFTTKGEAGTGMGLPIVKHIVESQHGGRVEIEPRRGKGTTVMLLLPNQRVEER